MTRCIRNNIFGLFCLFCGLAPIIAGLMLTKFTICPKLPEHDSAAQEAYRIKGDAWCYDALQYAGVLMAIAGIFPLMCGLTAIASCGCRGDDAPDIETNRDSFYRYMIL